MRAVPVAVDVNGQTDYTYSAASTPRAIAQQAGASVAPTDYVTAQPTQNFLQSGAIGQQVIIDSGIPINLNLYGTNLPIFVHASTVSELIAAENIHLFPGDKLTPVYKLSYIPQ
ncbi:MAG: ubiquitin-like domain-containing protein [Candidatus Saccharibacteria bacterium]